MFIWLFLRKFCSPFQHVSKQRTTPAKEWLAEPFEFCEGQRPQPQFREHLQIRTLEIPYGLYLLKSVLPKEEEKIPAQKSAGRKISGRSGKRELLGGLSETDWHRPQAAGSENGRYNGGRACRIFRELCVYSQKDVSHGRDDVHVAVRVY